MKVSGLLSACVLAALPLSVLSQDGSPSGAARGDIEIGDLVTRYAKSSGKQFVIDPRVRGQVPLAGVDPARITYEQLLAVLDVHQLAVMESGGVLAVVPDANARQLAAPTYSDANFKAMDRELVTLLVQPKNVCAAYMVPVLRPLMPQAAHLAADLQTNTLIINDRAANARRIAGLVEQLDKRGTGKKECPSPAGFTMASPASAPAAKPGS
jgi:general secretion pathway protein D